MHKQNLELTNYLFNYKFIMKIIVLGGDGFCGCPVSLSLSINHEVLIIDNFFRRNIDTELSISSLTPIKTLEERLKTWNLKHYFLISMVLYWIQRQTLFIR